MPDAAALLLAAVLGWAAASKVHDPRASKTAVVAFGLPAVIAPVLPFAEACLALGLIARPVVAAPLAGALFAFFTLVVARAVMRGTAVACGCFGGSDHVLVGTHTILRNVALIGAAAIASSGDGVAIPSLPGVITVTTAALVVTVIAALIRLRSEIGPVFAPRLVRPIGPAVLRPAEFATAARPRGAVTSHGPSGSVQ
jgi:hypothetical protein